MATRTGIGGNSKVAMVWFTRPLEPTIKDRELMMTPDKMNVVDMITVDEAGRAVLHLVVDGTWEDLAEKVELIRRRLNIYGAFVSTGQLAAIGKYHGREVKILVHCERPPIGALAALSKMKVYLAEAGLAMGVSVGTELSREILFP